VHISEAEYEFTAPSTVHILNTITITVTGEEECTITVKPQTVGNVAFSNSAPHGKVIVTPAINNIAYTSTGKICGASGANGTYTGKNEVERVGGGFVTYDA
jgi:hypothetical protein